MFLCLPVCLLCAFPSFLSALLYFVCTVPGFRSFLSVFVDRSFVFCVRRAKKLVTVGRRLTLEFLAIKLH